MALTSHNWFPGNDGGYYEAALGVGVGSGWLLPLFTLTYDDTIRALCNNFVSCDFIK